MIFAMGQNEDAVLVNRAAAERGLFRSLVRKRVSAPVGGKRRVAAGDILGTGVDGRLSRCRAGEEGVLHDGILTLDRPLEDGDKITNRHGQKGTARLVAPEDLPFVGCNERNTIIPDLVINPDSFPKRMPVGQLLEMALGKQIAASWDPVRTAGAVTVGATGKLILAPVEVGICFYGKMEQMAASKINVAGANVATDPLTGQPEQGRKRGGGVRFGHMESNAALASGADAFVRERTLVHSDGARRERICADCFLPAAGYVCAHCGPGHRIEERLVPRSWDLAKEELFCLGVGVN